MYTDIKHYTSPQRRKVREELTTDYYTQTRI